METGPCAKAGWRRATVPAVRGCSIAAVVLILGGCAGGKMAATQPSPVPTPNAGVPAPDDKVEIPPGGARTLAADETITSASGAKLTAAAGWSVAIAGGVVTITGPEADLATMYPEVEADAGPGGDRRGVGEGAPGVFTRGPENRSARPTSTRTSW